jgi:hypothetical protein
MFNNESGNFSIQNQVYKILEYFGYIDLLHNYRKIKNKFKDMKEESISVDIEADGPIPGPYSMLSLGMAVVGRPDIRFYTELRPISDCFVPKALEVAGLDRERLLREAPHPQEAMNEATRWINKLRRIGRPVFLAAPAVWDGMFVHWYFVHFAGKSPFGQTGSGIDL